MGLSEEICNNLSAPRWRCCILPIVTGIIEWGVSSVKLGTCLSSVMMMITMIMTVTLKIIITDCCLAHVPCFFFFCIYWFINQRLLSNWISIMMIVISKAIKIELNNVSFLMFLYKYVNWSLQKSKTSERKAKPATLLAVDTFCNNPK